MAEGKLTPAERAQDGQPSCWLTALDAAALSSYRAARAPVVQTTDTAAKPAATTPAAVTDEVAALANQLGVDAATLATNLASARAAAV